MLDEQTFEIIGALRAKVNAVAGIIGQSQLAELYDPRRDRATLKRTALATNTAARTAAKPAAAPAAPAKPSAPSAPAKPDNEKQALAKIQAANAAAHAKAKADSAERRKAPEASDAKKALMSRIKKMLNQSVDDIDVSTLIEDMELYLSMTDDSDPTYHEVGTQLQELSASLLENYDVPEPLRSKLAYWGQ